MTSFDYEYRLPANHPPGVYWYHPHRHGSVADQIFGGLYGAIIIQDPQPVPVTRERVLVISDISLTGGGSIAAVSAMEKMMGREGALVLVNGQLNPALAVAGAPAAAPGPVPAQPAPRDLRAAAVTAHRELVFAIGMDMGMNSGGPGMGGGRGSGMMSFTINGRPFNPARVDTTVPAGAIEEWTLRNTSPMDHPVHLHVWSMQIIEQAGRPMDSPAWQDVVNVPARSSVRVRIAFDDSPGKPSTPATSSTTRTAA